MAPQAKPYDGKVGAHLPTPLQEVEVIFVPGPMAPPPRATPLHVTPHSANLSNSRASGAGHHENAAHELGLGSAPG
jgi:hypothetical protein